MFDLIEFTDVPIEIEAVLDHDVDFTGRCGRCGHTHVENEDSTIGGCIVCDVWEDNGPMCDAQAYEPEWEEVVIYRYIVRVCDDPVLESSSPYAGLRFFDFDEALREVSLQSDILDDYDRPHKERL